MGDIAGEQVVLCKNGDGRVAVQTRGRHAGFCQECIERRVRDAAEARATSNLGDGRRQPTPQQPAGAAVSGSNGSKASDLAGMAAALVPTAKRVEKALRAKRAATVETRTVLGTLRSQMEAMVNELRRLEQDAA